MAAFSRITRDPTVMGGTPCVRNTHIPASTVVALLATGRSTDDILQMFSALKVEDIREALAYAAWGMDQPQATAHEVPVLDKQSPTPAARLAAFNHFSSSPSFLQPPKTSSVSSNGAKHDSEEPSETASSDAPEDAEGESMALFHPDHPDHATVILNRHGLYDRRWSTGIIAWCDIRDIRRIPAEKTIVITLHNPRGYLSSMTFFKRLMARIRLWLNLRTLYLDTSSLGARTQDILIVANRLWLRNRGKGRLGKKRRIRIGKSRNSRSRPLWSDYE